MSYILTAVKRAKGALLREQGKLPAVVYGAGKESQPIALEAREFGQVYQKAGESSLIDLVLDSKDEGKVLVQDVQYDPIKGYIIHVDLRYIDMEKRMTANVELRFIGEAPAIKEAGGTLVRSIEEVEVECLPKDLVSHIEVDVSSLKTFDDAIKVKNLTLPAGITIISPEGNALVTKAQPAITEEEIKAMEEAAKTVDVGKIEVAGKEEKTPEETAVEEGPEPKQKE